MFKLIKDTIYFEEEILKTFPVLADKKNRNTLLYVIFAVYYGSPFAGLPEKERWQMSKRKVFGKKEVETENLPGLKEIRYAIESIQFDIDRETLRIYIEKIGELNLKLQKESDEKNIANIDNAIERLSKRSKQMTENLRRKDEAVIIKGGGVLTYLENWQNNMVKKKEAEKRQQETTGIVML